MNTRESIKTCTCRNCRHRSARKADARRWANRKLRHLWATCLHLIDGTDTPTILVNYPPQG